MLVRYALSGAALILLTGGAFGESFVKTKAECTRFGGQVFRSGDADYPFRCLTPQRDRECVRKHGEGHFFEAEYGVCMDEECLYFELDFPELCVAD
jgi:hypothetical protein